MTRDDSAATGRQLVHAPGDPDDVPGHRGGWLDAIALAASQTREHTEHPAVTEVGAAVIAKSGGHHFDHNYDELADQILAAVPQ